MGESGASVARTLSRSAGGLTEIEGLSMLILRRPELAALESAASLSDAGSESSAPLWSGLSFIIILNTLVASSARAKKEKKYCENVRIVMFWQSF
jgi:hypothetical protein